MLTLEISSDTIIKSRVKRRQHKDFKAMRNQTGTLKTKQQCNPEKFQEKISEQVFKRQTKTVKKNG